MDIILTAILTAAAVLGGVTLAAVYVYRRLLTKMVDFFTEWTSPGENNTPSPLASIADQLAVTFAQRMTASLKSSFLGMQSVATRNEQRLQGDLTMDLASQASPILGAALQSFPAVRKRLEKNPELLAYAMQFLNKGAAAAPGNGSAALEQQSNQSMTEY